MKWMELPDKPDPRRQRHAWFAWYPVTFRDSEGNRGKIFGELCDRILKPVGGHYAHGSYWEYCPKGNL